MNDPEFGPRWNGETPLLQFRGMQGEQLGAIWHRDGKFSFEGDADESVKNLMRALDFWGKNFTPRYEFDLMTKHAATLSEYLTRMQVSFISSDKKRLEMQLAQASDYIKKFGEDWRI